MAYKFVSTTRSKDEETAYILYAVLGSYFKKAVCKQKNAELTMYLHYKEMPTGQADNMWDAVEKAAEMLLGDMAESLSELYCEVRFAHTDEGYQVTFSTGFETIKAVAFKNGRYQLELEELKAVA